MTVAMIENDASPGLTDDAPPAPVSQPKPAPRERASSRTQDHDGPTLGGVVAHGAGTALVTAGTVLTHIGGLGALDTAGMVAGGGGAALYGASKLGKKARRRSGTKRTSTKRTSTRSGMGGLGLAGGRKKRGTGGGTGAAGSTHRRKKGATGLGLPGISGPRSKRRAATGSGGSASKGGLGLRRKNRGAAGSTGGGGRGRLNPFRGRTSRSGTSASGAGTRKSMARRGAARTGGATRRTLGGLNRVVRNKRMPKLVRLAAALLAVPLALLVAPFELAMRHRRKVAAKREEAEAKAAEQEQDKEAGTGEVHDSDELSSGVRALRRGRITHTTNGDHIVSSGNASLDAVAEAFQEHIGNFAPDNVAELETFLKGFGELFSNMAASVTQLGERLTEDHAVDAAVPEAMDQVVSGLNQLHDYCETTHETFTTRHEQELERINNPRSGEQFWDVSQQ